MAKSKMSEVIKEQVGQKKERLCELNPGEVFKVGTYEFVILEQLEGKANCLMRKPLPEKMMFGYSEDWSKSNLREYLNGEFYWKLSGAIGKENIVPHVVDLTADDGLTFGSTRDYISILTNETYRKYRNVIPGLDSEIYWTATAKCANENEDKRYPDVCAVDVDGCIYSGQSYSEYFVRPFCALKSSVFVERA